MVGETGRPVGRQGWELLCGPESGQPAAGKHSVEDLSLGYITAQSYREG